MSAWVPPSLRELVPTETVWLQPSCRRAKTVLSLIATELVLKVTTMGHDEASQDGIRLAGYFMTPGWRTGPGSSPGFGGQPRGDIPDRAERSARLRSQCVTVTVRSVCRRRLPKFACRPLSRFCLTHALTCGGGLTMVEKSVQNVHTELEPINRDTLVDAVEHAGKVEICGQLQRGESVALDAELAERLGVGSAEHRVGHDPGSRVGGQQRVGHGLVEGALGRDLDRDVPVDDIPGQLGPDQFVQLGEELILVAGQVATVDLGLRLLRDD